MRHEETDKSCLQSKFRPEPQLIANCSRFFLRVEPAQKFLAQLREVNGIIYFHYQGEDWEMHTSQQLKTALAAGSNFRVGLSFRQHWMYGRFVYAIVWRETAILPEYPNIEAHE